MENIQAGPHYELPSTELAKWLETEVPNSWWNVFGDPLLTGRIFYPCASDELAAELRKIDRPLLVQAAKDNTEATGQKIVSHQIRSLLTRYQEELFAISPVPPPWAKDLWFNLCWKGSTRSWTLEEDSTTAKQFLEDTIANAE